MLCSWLSPSRYGAWKNQGLDLCSVPFSVCLVFSLHSFHILFLSPPLPVSVLSSSQCTRRALCCTCLAWGLLYTPSLWPMEKPVLQDLLSDQVGANVLCPWSRALG